MSFDMILFLLSFLVAFVIFTFFMTCRQIIANNSFSKHPTTIVTEV